MTFCVVEPTSNGSLLHQNFKKAGFSPSQLLELINDEKILKANLAQVHVLGRTEPVELRNKPLDHFRFGLSKSQIFLHLGDEHFLVKALICNNGITTNIESSGIYIQQGQRPAPLLAASSASTANAPEGNHLVIEGEAERVNDNNPVEEQAYQIGLQPEFEEAAKETRSVTKGRNKELMPLYLRIVNELDENALAEYFVTEDRTLKFFAYKILRDEADAEDVVQTAFMKALACLQAKRNGTSDSLCREPAYLGTWIHQIIKNNAFNMRNNKVNSAREHFDTVNEHPDDGFGQGSLIAESSLDSLAPDEFQDPLHYLMQQEEQASIKELVRNITDAAANGNERLTMLLASSMKLSGLDTDDITGMPEAASYDELAARYNIPLGTVRSRIFRARKLAEKLAPR